jgi:hypothetical protein
LSIQDLSVDDALWSFRFQKEHLQEVSDKLCHWLSVYLNGVKGKIVFGDGRYSAPLKLSSSWYLTHWQHRNKFVVAWKNSSVFEGLNSLLASKQWPVQCTHLIWNTLMALQFSLTGCHDMWK